MFEGNLVFNSKEARDLGSSVDYDSITEVQPESDRVTSVTEEESVSKPFITLPYKGNKGESIVPQFRKTLNRALPQSVKPQIVYTGTQVSSFFRVKDKVPLEHQSDLVYRFRLLEMTRYVGETNVRRGHRNHEHLHTDKNSSIYKFLRSNEDIVTDENNFEILETGLSNKITRKLAESLYIKAVSYTHLTLPTILRV